MSDQFDVSNLLERAQAMQHQMMEAQAAAAEQVVEGQSAGGAVKVRMTGDMGFRSVSIDPAVVDPDDVELLEDMVLAAGRDAVVQVRELAREAIGEMGLGQPTPPDRPPPTLPASDVPGPPDVPGPGV